MKQTSNTTFDCSQLIEKKIKDGTIQMKPTWMFYLGTATFLFGVTSFTLLASLLLSFVWYHSVNRGYANLLEFGTRGWLAVMVQLPWVAVGTSFILVLIGWWMIKHSELGCRYRKRVIGTALLSFVLVVSLFFHQFDPWAKTSQEPMRWLESGVSTTNPPVVLYGRIVNKNQEMYVLAQPQGVVVPVRMNKQSTQYYGLVEKPLIGEWVLVFGRWEDSYFDAERVKFWTKEN